MVKPKCCEQCVVVKAEKGMIKCGCMPSLTAKTYEEKLDMWKNCPIMWDKK